MKKVLHILGILALFTVFISAKPKDSAKDEPYRAQYHFTPEINSQKQVQSLVTLGDEYHLFYQMYPLGNDSTDMSWGHAVSTDLLHWDENENSIIPEGICEYWSGTAVADEQNVSGLKSGQDPPLLFYYMSDECDMQLIYSNDGGENWERYSGDLSISIEGMGYDPNIIWYEESGKFIMTMWTQKSEDDENEGITFYSSSDLFNWKVESYLDGISDSPVNLVEMPVDGSASNSKWVLFDSSGSYYIGSFDGKTFTFESDKLGNDFGTNYYGPQTTSLDEGTTVQMAWIYGGSYPDMPFSGQMTFPVELSLTETTEGIRLLKKPISEIESLHEEKYLLVENESQYPGLGENLAKKASGDCLHIVATIDIGNSDYCGFLVRNDKKDTGLEVYYDATKNTINCNGKETEMSLSDDLIKLEILVDRTSFEVYANDGIVVFSSTVSTEPDKDGVLLFNSGGVITVKKMEIYNLKSIYSAE